MVYNRLIMKNKIIFWLRQQVRAAGAQGIILGLSGGIDSAVVAALCKEAVGSNRLLALLMPIHSHPTDLEDAKIMARKFGITTKTVDLSGLYDNFTKLLPSADKLARANLKPRLRMVTLYYFANKLNYLVCGTGNRTELMAGYFTKYGDGGVDLLPLGDLFKNEVRALAKELSIPEQIIIKPPTAGLWPGQTDEGEMGMSYPVLDGILERMAEKKSQIARKIKVDKVKKMVQQSEHKRQGPAICFI